MEDNAQTPQPIITEASEKPKTKNPYKLATVIFAILALAGAGFGVYEYLQSNQAKQRFSDLKIEVKNTDGSTTIIETDKIKVKDDSETIVITDMTNKGTEDVKKIIGEIRSAAAEHFGISEAYFYQTFGYGSTITIPGTNIKTSTNESYGFAVPDKQDELGERILLEVPDVVKETLSGKGFSSSERLDPPLNWISLYYNSEKDIYCLVPESSSYYSVDCTKTSWLTNEKKELVLALAKAAGEYARNWVDAEPNDIEDSPVSPYQRLLATTNDAHLHFYRISPESEWVFLGGTQMGRTSCDWYNEDAKKAFSGTKCYDETTETEVEL